MVVVSSTNTTAGRREPQQRRAGIVGADDQRRHNVNLTSITGLTTPQQPVADGSGATPSVQMPVWVPWQQQLRPLGALLGTLTPPTP